MAYKAGKHLHTTHPSVRPPERVYRSYGSLAYAPEELPREEVRPEEGPSVRREKPQSFWKARLHLLFLVGVVFVGAIAVAGSFAVLKQEQVKLSRMQDELATLQSANVALEAEITEEINLDYVEQEAKGRLGMSEPQSYQIVYIDVPRESTTTQYAEETPEKTSVFSIGSMGNLLNRTDKK